MFTMCFCTKKTMRMCIISNEDFTKSFITLNSGKSENSDNSLEYYVSDKTPVRCLYFCKQAFSGTMNEIFVVIFAFGSSNALDEKLL